MIFEPPGSAKSTYASVVFPSKYLGEQGGRRVILASYGAELARKMGRRTRSIIRQSRYRQLFNCALSNESHAADRFTLTNGSEYMASGLLSGITGNRADGAIADDPVSGREDAESEAMRQKTWDAWRDDLQTRLVPGGWLVLVMTRWNIDDVAGRILPENWNGESGVFDCRDGRKWRVLCLQARCETTSDPLGRQIGEYLWPEWFDAEHWQGLELEPYSWNSLQQQRPRPMEGGFFTEKQLLVKGDDGVYRPVETPQLVDCVFATIDTAVKSGKSHDGLAVVFHALTTSGSYPIKLVVLDWDITKLDGALLEQWIPSVFARLEELARLTRARLGSVGAWIEDKAAGSILLQQVAEKYPLQAIDSKLTSMGKTERGFNASGKVYAGDVKIARHAYEKTVEYEGAMRNHFLSQVTGFRPGAPEGSADDLFDDFCYGIAIGIGNPDGF